ncbi:MAG: DUF2442 domain-containing protein [Thiohalospira sp.]
MKSSAHGETTLPVEVTNISAHGIWLMEREREHFLPYDAFPWFREQPVSAILRVEEPAPGHFHWPELDVDLTVAMIEHPERYPEIASV